MRTPFRAAKILDIAMLVIPSGQERTEEYRRLLKQAGFRLTRVVPLRTSASIEVCDDLDGYDSEHGLGRSVFFDEHNSGNRIALDLPATVNVLQNVNLS